MDIKLEKYLIAYGWKYRRIGDHQIVTGWAGNSRDYHLHIETMDTLVCFSIEKFFSFDEDYENFPEILVLLLEMNKESPLLKLSLDSRGDVILLAEVMQNQLSEDNFFNLISVMGHYADQFHFRLSHLAEKYQLSI